MTKSPRYTYGVRETFPSGGSRLLCVGARMGVARGEYFRRVVSSSGHVLRSGNVAIAWESDGPHVFEVFRDSQFLPGVVV